MYKYLVFLIFVSIFFWLIKKDRIYVIPFILITYSNINGLLDWEDFALKGVVKFQDYGLIATLLLLFFSWISHNKYYKKKQYLMPSGKSKLLFTFIKAYWAYYIFLIVYSIILQGGDVEWPIKMGRMFFYGLVIFVTYSMLKSNPIEKFEKIIKVLMISTLIFGMMYVGYNILGIEFYPKGEHEAFYVDRIGEVKRNFSGFPAFCFYFLILFTHRFLSFDTSKVLNFYGVVLMASCVFLTLTRGAVLAMAAVLLITTLYRVPSITTFRKVIGLTFACVLALPFLLQFGQGHLKILTLRFSEFADAGGAAQSGNFVVRVVEFSKILGNVVDFNPLFGFGFTNVFELGYQSNLIHGGSADNGFANLIGVTGIVGLVLFLAVIFAWLFVNVKLQKLGAERYSKVNFIFIIYLLASLVNGSSMSYMHTYGLFMIYDLLALAYFSAKLKALHLARRTDHQHNQQLVIL